MTGYYKYVKVEHPDKEICVGVLQPKPRKIRKKLIFINEDGYKIKALVTNYHTSDKDSISSCSDSDE